MNIKYVTFLLLANLFCSHASLASMIVMPPEAKTKTHADIPKVLSVMSMGQLQSVDVEAKTLRINGVVYSFAAGDMKFIGIAGGSIPSSQLKVGDWVHFWIKSSVTQQSSYQLERLELMVNPESRKVKQ
ncbi:hypothetical protein [Sulfuriferula nivalis]|uniref:Copper-binding protein n=1 Tax=Sulfuriferula nivalis TaxID=2675298 RepID=A0A809S9X0_9PROT|nr:hypothetical protein [Sulfuriferula nivalis]BBP01202.1 hypothetical protein SFSGTM_19100 [Sulfuriferula nivalis]